MACGNSLFLFSQASPPFLFCQIHPLVTGREFLTEMNWSPKEMPKPSIQFDIIHGKQANLHKQYCSAYFT